MKGALLVNNLITSASATLLQYGWNCSCSLKLNTIVKVLITQLQRSRELLERNMSDKPTITPSQLTIRDFCSLFSITSRRMGLH